MDAETRDIASNTLREALNTSSAERVALNQDDHKAHDAGRSLVYDAKECNAYLCSPEPAEG